MRELGRDAHEIVWDFESLQRKWAEENGVRFNNDSWMFDVLMAQIKTIKPDVIYFQGTELAIPGRFDKLSSNTNFATALKEEFPFIRLIAMLSGFPSKGSRLSDVDVLFSASPSIQQHYKNLGFPSLLCYHAFDHRVLEILGNKNLVYDFSFVGSARAPEQRYWDLLELLDRTAIQLWIDEPITEQRKSYFLDRKRFESDLRSQIRNRAKACLKVVGETGLELLAGKDRVPRKIRNLAIEIISEISKSFLLICILNLGSLFIPTDALTPIPNKESSISMVNFLINFFLTSRLILLYNTDALTPSFFESMGTEMFPSLDNSKSSFISISSNRCNDRKKNCIVINVDFINIVHVNFN
mgnify:CR=1 FL=1